MTQFTFCHQEVQQGLVPVKPVRTGNFKEKPGFALGSDTVIKTFNNNLYVMCASSLQLHIFDTQAQQWSVNSLSYYKVPVGV